MGACGLGGPQGGVGAVAYVKSTSIKVTLDKAIRYIVNPDKTNEKILVTNSCGSFDNDPKEITASMLRVRRLAYANRGTGKFSQVLAHHVVQSFKPGEVDPATAHEIGQDYAERLLGDEYQWVVATHIDRDHIHNHLIYSTTNRLTWKQKIAPRRYIDQLRTLSNELTRARGLSVIEPEPRGVARPDIGQVYASMRGASTQAQLRNLIDEAVYGARSLTQLRRALEAKGVGCRDGRAGLVFTYKGRSVYARRLGPAYSEQALVDRLGRAAMDEFTISSRMVIRDGQRLLVRLPKKEGEHRDTFWVVPIDNMIDQGNVVRVWASRRSPQIICKHDKSFHYTTTTDGLYERLMRPDPTSYRRVPGFQALDGVVMSQARANFDAWVQTQTFTAVNELHAAGVAASLAGQPLAVVEGKRAELASQLEQVGARLRDATIEMQLLDDAEPDRPASMLDFDVVNLGRTLGSLHADYVAVNKLCQARHERLASQTWVEPAPPPSSPPRPIDTPPPPVAPRRLLPPEPPQEQLGRERAVAGEMRPSWKIDQPGRIEAYETSLRMFDANEIGPHLAKLQAEWEELQAEARTTTSASGRADLQKRVNWCHIRLELSKQRRDYLQQIQHRRKGPRL